MFGRQTIFASARSEKVHIAGYKAVVRMKGGVGQLRERIVAIAVS
jgi:hypothetical protein